MFCRREFGFLCNLVFSLRAQAELSDQRLQQQQVLQGLKLREHQQKTSLDRSRPLIADSISEFDQSEKRCYNMMDDADLESELEQQLHCATILNKNQTSHQQVGLTKRVLQLEVFNACGQLIVSPIVFKLKL